MQSATHYTAWKVIWHNQEIIIHYPNVARDYENAGFEVEQIRLPYVDK